MHSIPICISKINELVNIIFLESSLTSQVNIYGMVAHKYGNCNLVSLEVYFIQFKFKMRYLRDTLISSTTNQVLSFKNVAHINIP